MKRKRGQILAAVAAALLMAFAAYLYWDAQNTEALSSCPGRHSGIDIGSGSTKLLIADVDPCKQKILRIVHQASTKVDYKHDLSFHEHQFSDEIRQQGLLVLREYLATIENLGATLPLVLATEAFRQAKNAGEYLSQIHTGTGLEVRIINQSTEATLSFFSALTATDISPENAVVWDIGGGSQQISFWQNGELQNRLVSWGSISFKEKVVAALGKSTLSPNPLTWPQVQIAQSLVEATVDFPRTGKTIIGVGGVFVRSLLPRLEESGLKIHRVDLEDLLARTYFLSDEQLGSEYAETDTTNIIMVATLMNQYELPEVMVAKVGLLEGALANPQLLAFLTER